MLLIMMMASYNESAVLLHIIDWLNPKENMGGQSWVYVKNQETDKQANLEKEFFLYGLQRKSEKERFYRSGVAVSDME